MNNTVNFITADKSGNRRFIDRALIPMREETLELLLDARQVAHDALDADCILDEDGLAGVARLAELWHCLAKPPMVAAMVGRPEDMLTLLLDRLCAVFLTDPPTGTEGLAMCAELMFMAGELTEGLWFE